MEPVMVPGSAMIRLADIESQYPPEAATSDMETTTGFIPFVSSSSCRITSEE